MRRVLRLEVEGEFNLEELQKLTERLEEKLNAEFLGELYTDGVVLLPFKKGGEQIFLLPVIKVKSTEVEVYKLNKRELKKLGVEIE